MRCLVALFLDARHVHHLLRGLPQPRSQVMRPIVETGYAYPNLFRGPFDLDRELLAPGRIANEVSNLGARAPTDKVGASFGRGACGLSSGAAVRLDVPFAVTRTGEDACPLHFPADSGRFETGRSSLFLTAIFLLVLCFRLGLDLILH